jgi:hypothetical protein
MQMEEDMKRDGEVNAYDKSFNKWATITRRDRRHAALAETIKGNGTRNMDNQKAGQR